MTKLLTVVLLFVASFSWAAEPTLVIEAAATAEGPWVQVPIGPEALDLKGAIVWEGLPAELKFVRVRVVAPVVTEVSCVCDACVEVR
jgi:hypothetical protein